MKNDQLDHAPIVEAWLKEPSLLPPSDTARLTQLVHQTPQQRRWWQRYFTGRTQTMIHATSFAAASLVLALTGGLLYFSFLAEPEPTQPVPAAVTSSPSAESSVEPVESAAPVVETVAPETVVVDPVLVMQPGSGEAVGGFTQVGRLSTRDARGFGEMQDLSVVGDTLVARNADNGTAPILYSTDGMAWGAATIPGNGVQVEDLVMTDDELMAAGSSKVDGERVARLWTSTDGVEWVPISAPPGKRVHQVVSTQDGAMLVRTNDQVWLLEDDGQWTRWNKVVNSSIERGPGGILSWQGGGQDRSIPTFVLHWSSPQSALSEVILPKPLEWNVAGEDSPHMGIDVFALDDTWVMVGSEHKAPDTIHQSANGLEWEDVPRPPEMAQGSVRWIEQVGDQVQAHAMLALDDGNPAAVWTWTLGEEVPEAEILAGSDDEWLNAPIAWQGGYVATGYDRGRDQFLTLWRMEAAQAE